MLRACGLRICAIVAGLMIIPPLCAQPLSAQPQSTQEMAFSALAARLDEHPSVQAILHARDGTLHEALSAQSALPDPIFTLGVNNLPTEKPALDRYLPTSISYEVAQRFPKWGERAARAGRLKKTAHMRQLQAEAQKAQLRATLVATLAHLRRIEGTMGLLRHQRRLYDEWEASLRGQIEGGQALFGDFAKLDGKRTEIDRKLNRLRGEEAIQRAELDNLLPGADPIAPPGIKPNEWNGTDEALFPLAIARQKIDAATEEIREKESAYLPDVKLGAAYQQRESGRSFSGEDWVTAKLSLSLPLWAASSQTPRLEAAKARRMAARRQREEQRRRVKTRLAILKADYDTAGRAITLLQSKQGSLLEMAQAARRTYESGTGRLSHVLSPTIARLGLKMEQLEREAELIIKAAEINRLFTTPAEKNTPEGRP